MAVTDFFILPPGAYFDSDEMLCDARGVLLPDGIYQEEDGNIFIYEGNFMKKATFKDEDFNRDFWPLKFQDDESDSK